MGYLQDMELGMELTMEYVRKHFKFIKEAGSGSYGSVEIWERVGGTEQSLFQGPAPLPERLAIKKFKPEFGESAEYEEKMYRGLTHHDHLVKFLGASEDQGTKVLILEYMPSTLQEVVDDAVQRLGLCRRLWWNRVKTWTHQITLGLNYLHKNGVIHCDLKPDNILVDVQGKKLKICDLGHAQNFSDEDVLADLSGIGAVVYKAPELLRGDKHYGKAIDIWSLGCVVFKMLTGKDLIEEKTDSAQLDRIIEEFGDFSAHPVDTVPMPCLAPSTASPTKPVQQTPAILTSELQGNPKEAIQFCASCLRTSPSDRPTCEELLRSDFLKAPSHSASEKRARSKVSMAAVPMVRIANSLALNCLAVTACLVDIMIETMV